MSGNQKSMGETIN